MNFPYWFFFRDIQPLNMHARKTDSWEETPDTRVKVSQFTGCDQKRAAIMCISQSYTEKTVFHKSRAQHFIMHHTTEGIHSQ